jgi:hypothetical protein
MTRLAVHQPEAASVDGAFDYSAPCEVFMAYARKRPVTYRRFPSAADAIRFAMEESPASLLVGAVMEVDEVRFDHRGIRELYEGDGYPLQRKRTMS